MPLVLRSRIPARLAPLGIPLLLALAGCSTAVAAGLDETDANTIVLALDRVGIDATKEVDPAVEGKFKVEVPRDEAARALGAMRDEDLPRPHAPGLSDAVDKGALVPSQQIEHAQIVSGTAGELARSLEGIDGVLAARVHLSVPAPDPLRDLPLPKTTASVLLSHRGATPPLTTEAVQKLVAGGVANLLPADVAVVMIARSAPGPGGRSELAHVGPIAVARSSMRPLQLALAGGILVLILFAAMTLTLLSKLGRARADLEIAQAARGGAGGPPRDAPRERR